MIRVELGDSAEVLKRLDDSSIDALITDPPAGISFMGKTWDDPKNYGYSDGGMRVGAPPTVNLGRNPTCQTCGGRKRAGPATRGCACETPTFNDLELRTRDRDAFIGGLTPIFRECLRTMKPGAHGLVWALPRTAHWTTTALEDAGFEIRDVVIHLFGTGFPKSLNVAKAGGGEKWTGWGTALKPAAEHWILVRKPLEGTVVENTLRYGTGAINIDASRLEGAPDPTSWAAQRTPNDAGGRLRQKIKNIEAMNAGLCSPPSGRFPSHLVLDEEAAAALDVQSGLSAPRNAAVQRHSATSNMSMRGGNQARLVPVAADPGGGASRFFYVAKAPKSDKGIDNTHPTVKNTKLMEYLIRLITPPGGIVLDCFMGSGSTGVAAKQLGFDFIGIERERKYFEIAQRRLGISTPPSRVDDSIAYAAQFD